MNATTDGTALNVLSSSGTAVALRNSKGGSSTLPSEKGFGDAPRSSLQPLEIFVLRHPLAELFAGAMGH